jgi:hypothetical protein
MRELSNKAISILESPVSQYRGWRPQITCSGLECTGYRNVPISDLHDRICNRLGDPTIGEVIRMLRCSKCHGMPRSVELQHHMANEWLMGEDAGL